MCFWCQQARVAAAEASAAAAKSAASEASTRAVRAEERLSLTQTQLDEQLAAATEAQVGSGDHLYTVHVMSATVLQLVVSCSQPTSATCKACAMCAVVSPVEALLMPSAVYLQLAKCGSLSQHTS